MSDPGPGLRRIAVRGPRETITQLHAALQTRDVADVEVVLRRYVSRQPGQIELMDLVVSFVVGLASTATYEWLKSEVEDRHSAGGIEIIELGLSKSHQQPSSVDSNRPSLQ
jgi:hypothetical protein